MLHHRSHAGSGGRASDALSGVYGVVDGGSGKPDRGGCACARESDRDISGLSDERRLIAAAKAGDQRAYAQLLERHQAVAFRAAYLITGSTAEAEDATQEACVKAWLALRRFRPAAPFRPWLVRIAINEARNRRRGAGRRATLVLRLGKSSAGARPARSAEAAALAAEERVRLACAVGRLGENDQLVIAARYFSSCPRRRPPRCWEYAAGP